MELSMDWDAPVAPKPKLAEKTTRKAGDALRKKADALQVKIDHQMRPMTQNPTRKRTQEYQQRLRDGGVLEVTQVILRALADQQDDGTIIAELAKVKTSTEVDMLRFWQRGGYPVASPDDNEWVAKSKQTDRKRLTRLGLTSINVLTKAVASIKALESVPANPERDRVQEIERLELALVGVPIPGFFPTPAGTADKLATYLDVEAGMYVIDPSAGKGDLLEAVLRRRPSAAASGVEVSRQLADIAVLKGLDVICGDAFEQRSLRESFDLVIMNPPFEQSIDAAHVRAAYELLKPCGRMVAIMSEGVFFKSGRVCEQFRDWLESVDGRTVEKLPSGWMTGPGALRQTGVSARIVVIDKGSM